MKNWCPLLTLCLIAACGDKPDPSASADSIADLVDEYLFLELSMSGHDEGHVDAYFGPPGLRERAAQEALSLEEIAGRADRLASQLASVAPADAARIEGLQQRLLALRTRTEFHRGNALAFDEESERLFGARAPDHDAAYFQAILDDIDALIGGDGDLSTRVNDFRSRFIVPPERLATVFETALAECRRRTLLYMDLPANESFRIEYVSDKPWSGYNWYQGNAQSLIQVNTDLPIYIDRAVDLGCHEGYPGHHTYNALLEDRLVNAKNWQEFSLYPLFSPQSLIAEGSGNYGIDLAFPGDERIRYEQEVLFPLAGLDTDEADRYYELQEMLARLNYAGNEAARDYLNGEIDRDGAVEWLTTYAMSSPERAQQRTRFFDTYRSYVINYNLGKDIVRDYIELDTASNEERWNKFAALLSSPMTAKDIVPADP